MGANSSRLEKALTELPDGERYFGLENFGNTCYANSVLQTLYFCRPFRDKILQYAASTNGRTAEDNLLLCLAELFVQVSRMSHSCGRFLSGYAYALAVGRCEPHRMSF